MISSRKMWSAHVLWWLDIKVFQNIFIKLYRWFDTYVKIMAAICRLTRLKKRKHFKPIWEYKWLPPIWFAFFYDKNKVNVLNWSWELKRDASMPLIINSFRHFVDLSKFYQPHKSLMLSYKFNFYVNISIMHFTTTEFLVQMNNVQHSHDSWI